jgi:flagellar protein FliO/FliZ
LADPGTEAVGTLNATEAAPPELWANLLNSFGMLLLVLAILILVMWLLRRYLWNQGAAQQGFIRMLASMYVAPKERIALVDVLGDKLLIGITPQQITLLARIEDGKDICSTRQPEKPSEGFFKSLLKRNIDGASRDPQ